MNNANDNFLGQIAIENLRKLEFFTAYNAQDPFITARIDNAAAEAIRFSLEVFGVKQYIKDFMVARGYVITEGANGSGSLNISGKQELVKLAQAGIEFPGSEYFNQDLEEEEVVEDDFMMA